MSLLYLPFNRLLNQQFNPYLIRTMTDSAFMRAVLSVNILRPNTLARDGNWSHKTLKTMQFSFKAAPSKWPTLTPSPVHYYSRGCSSRMLQPLLQPSRLPRYWWSDLFPETRFHGLATDEHVAKRLEGLLSGSLDGYERLLSKQKYVGGNVRWFIFLFTYLFPRQF